jgi:uncharacterized protein (TIGR03437 family)
MSAKCLPLVTVVCGLCFAAAAATTPSFTSDGLVNAATGQAVFAPYSICTLYGTDLFLNGTATATGSSVVPNALGGVTVVFGLVRAGLFYVSANQINLLIPNSLGPGTYAVTVIRDGVASLTVPIVVQEVAPGLFAGLPGFAVALHADGTPVTADAPAIAGEVVVFFGTGLGRTQPDPMDRSIAQSAAEIVHSADFQVLLDGTVIDVSRVQYVGLTPSSAGLYQVNVRLPDDLQVTNPEVQVNIAGSLSPAGLRLITAPKTDLGGS